jgi:cytochrome c oxidase subunit 3/cytochrome o ubiquinol oxidase subunit 3
MSTASTEAVPQPTAWVLPSRGRVAMACLIIAESAIFTIFVVAYLFYIGKSLNGPMPRDVLELPIFISICLLSSSATIMVAERMLAKGRTRAFGIWWLATIILGVIFLAGTGLEWRRLVYEKGLTIATNLFGTTFYSLVGLHASHVIVGLAALLIVMILALAGLVRREHNERITVLAMYWHFVDTVWVVVFTVVYIIGR